jgi:hypothetical protein
VAYGVLSRTTIRRQTENIYFGGRTESGCDTVHDAGGQFVVFASCGHGGLGSERSNPL